MTTSNGTPIKVWRKLNQLSPEHMSRTVSNTQYERSPRLARPTNYVRSVMGLLDKVKGLVGKNADKAKGAVDKLDTE
jgi:hypothetical protein